MVGRTMRSQTPSYRQDTVESDSVVGRTPQSHSVIGRMPLSPSQHRGVKIEKACLPQVGVKEFYGLKCRFLKPQDLTLRCPAHLRVKKV